MPVSLIPETCEYVTLPSKRDSADVIELRTLRWNIILDYLGGPTITRRGTESKGEGLEDAMLLNLMMWEGATIVPRNADSRS